jgi:hypothetical protein
VVADGGGDLGVFAWGCGEVAADEALELGEFADHLGDEIGLAEARRRGPRGESSPSPHGRGRGPLGGAGGRVRSCDEERKKTLTPSLRSAPSPRRERGWK